MGEKKLHYKKFIMGEKKLHYKMYKDGKKWVFAAIATLSFVVFGGGYQR
ncbi:KxYKxGKxW signal peptide domain-containing protein [Enterococcus faecalis]